MPLTSREELLMIHCIKDEVKAFLYNGDDKYQKQQRREARHWIFDDDYNEQDNMFSLQNICVTLGKDIEKLRTRVLVAKHFNLSLSQFISLSESGKLDQLIKELNSGKNKLRKTQKKGEGKKARPIRKPIKNAKLREGGE